MLQQLFFAYFAVTIIVFSILVITRRNPVHSVLWMLLLFFHIASLYLFLNAEFIAAIQIIVYAGAILVLYLFAILFLNIKEEVTTNRFISAWPTGFTLGIALFIVFILSLRSFIAAPPGNYSIELIKAGTHTKALAKVLYTDFLFPFEVASVVLLVAIVGAIVLAKRRLKS
ncbi:MAG: NADH-quinone oxidoreductase subunit J [Nitrospirae bacterium]|nr:NADH-quinone oxidoreductase subunit J [Nitrospirota bacterium]